jgi:hypothetical protein
VAPTRISEIDPLTDPRWPEFLSKSDGALVYHHPAWLSVLKEVFDNELIALACENDDGSLEGVLPLFRTRGRIAGDALSSLPHTPAAGPLARTDEAAQQLLSAAAERACSEPGVTLQIRSSRAGLDRLIDGLVGIPWTFWYTRDLPPADETLRFRDARNHGAVMRAVRKAESLGIDVRESDTKTELRGWYHLYLRTMRSHYTPPLPYFFFDTLWDVLRPLGLMRLLLAWAPGGRMVAGSMFLLYGRTVWFAYNGRRETDLSTRPNDAIQWRAIRDAHAEGYRHYDMGEVACDNPGLAAFKRKWGMEQGFLYRYYLPQPPARRILVPGSRAQRLVRTPWRRLPLRVTSFLGERLYR